MAKVIGRSPERVSFVMVINKKTKRMEILAVQDFTGRKP